MKIAVTVRRMISLIAAALISASSHASNLAYAGTDFDQFGVIDLDTGTFSKRGNMGAMLSGLVLAPNGSLYGGEALARNWYQVDTSNGSLTLLGQASFVFGLGGATSGGAFAVSTDGLLFSIDWLTGTSRGIGPTGLGSVLDGSVWGLSNGGDVLYLTRDATLYTIDTATGRARAVAASGQGTFGSLTFQAGTLYAGSFFPPAIYRVSPSSGSGTLVAALGGVSEGAWGLAPVAQVPEPAPVVLLVCGAAVLLGHSMRRRK